MEKRLRTGIYQNANSSSSHRDMENAQNKLKSAKYYYLCKELQI